MMAQPESLEGSVMFRPSTILAAMAAIAAANPCLAEQVTVAGGPVYVTRSDCAALVQHHPAPGVAYQPGRDVHGKYVAPADMAGSDYSRLLPDKLQFEVRVNPLAYGAQGQSLAQQEKFGNTAMSAGQVQVDLKTGETSLNGMPLTPPQDQALRDACRQAGVR